MRVILDTNIWISFLIGHQSQLMRSILTDSRVEVFVCPQLIAEIIDVANRGKIAKYLRPNDITDLFAIINVFCHSTDIKAEVPYNSVRDPKDVYLLSLAETIGADYIVSGDADLMVLDQYNSTRIIKLSDFKLILMNGLL